MVLRQKDLRLVKVRINNSKEAEIDQFRMRFSHQRHNILLSDIIAPLRSIPIRQIHNKYMIIDPNSQVSILNRFHTNRQWLLCNRLHLITLLRNHQTIPIMLLLVTFRKFYRWRMTKIGNYFNCLLRKTNQRHNRNRIKCKRYLTIPCPVHWLDHMLP
jgi:hypothetical protein